MYKYPFALLTLYEIENTPKLEIGSLIDTILMNFYSSLQTVFLTTISNAFTSTYDQHFFYLLCLQALSRCFGLVPGVTFSISNLQCKSLIARFKLGTLKVKLYSNSPVSLSLSRSWSLVGRAYIPAATAVLIVHEWYGAQTCA